MREANTDFPPGAAHTSRTFSPGRGAKAQILSFPEEQRLYLEINAKKDSCVIRYNTGELYYFERRPQQSWGYMQATDDSERTPSGAIRKSPVTLWEEVDGIASGLTGKQLKAKQYFNLPDSGSGRNSLIR